MALAARYRRAHAGPMRYLFEFQGILLEANGSGHGTKFAVYLSFDAHCEDEAVAEVDANLKTRGVLDERGRIDPARWDWYNGKLCSVSDKRPVLTFRLGSVQSAK
jgi:hypothetical protein